ncbi:uncharacterized protein DUF1572 [Cellulophaga sp. RHA19]|uniref:DUF1572 family protein n=1 Tax=Cellulophaga sp. RHA19 TaxID=1798237 RepID=UPI000C2B6177|nr:DUF1572 family protein [Cellulophaga sp. RHA19]PKB43795.1 uncharacterized protein DUF1572 [Cellulophaga sp. RHA19]
MSFVNDYKESMLFEFHRNKTMAEKTFNQLTNQDLHWTYGEADNSIAIIVKHMVGNMLSRWTNFFTEDGEKEWRNRESEFVAPYQNKEEMLVHWNKGWDCLFAAIDSINEDNFNNKIKIRAVEHSVMAAVSRQLAHYAGHIAQIAYVGRMLKGKQWQSLSIPAGKSDEFNKQMFSK